VTSPHYDYEHVLRRALHAAADSVDPSADGLDRIRERIGHPPLLSFASVASWYSVAALRLTGWAVPALGSAREIVAAVLDRFKPPEEVPGHGRPRFGWLRPAAAAALAIFVVAGGAFAAMAVPHVMSPAGHGSRVPGQSGSSGGGGGGGAASHGATPYHHSGSGTPGYTSSGPTGTSTGTTCHQVGSSPPPVVTTAPVSSVFPTSPPATSVAPTSPPPSSTSPAPGTTTPTATSTTTTTPPATDGTPSTSAGGSASGAASPGVSGTASGSAIPGGNQAGNQAARNTGSRVVQPSSSNGLAADPCSSAETSIEPIGLGLTALKISSASPLADDQQAADRPW
jgi:hypothetical protein